MPRKPSSVFLIAETPPPAGAALGIGGQLQAWRVALSDDVTIEQIVAAHYLTVPLGSRIYAVEDTKVTAFDVSPSVTAVDDPRLEQSS